VELTRARGLRYYTHLDVALEQTVFAEPVALIPQCHLRMTHFAFLRLFQWIFCIAYKVCTPAHRALPICIQRIQLTRKQPSTWALPPEQTYEPTCAPHLHFPGHPRDQVVVDRKFVENVIYNICHHLGAILPARATATETSALPFGRVDTHLHALARSRIQKQFCN
jgi:hypothetical protein